MVKETKEERYARRYERYAQYRDSRGFSDYYISKTCGIPQSTLTAWKQGRTCPVVDTLVSIASELGITVSELIGDD